MAECVAAPAQRSLHLRPAQPGLERRQARALVKVGQFRHPPEVERDDGFERSGKRFHTADDTGSSAERDDRAAVIASSPSRNRST